MNWLLDTITKHFNEWIANPIPNIIAGILGFSFGYFMSRLRHQGKIDTLEERLKHKDDVIAFKG